MLKYIGKENHKLYDFLSRLLIKLKNISNQNSYLENGSFKLELLITRK